MSRPSAFRRRFVAALISASLLAGTAACSKRSDEAASTAGGGAVAADELSVVFISGPLDDPFFGAMKRGVDDAEQQLGIDAEYLSPSSSKEGSGPTLARLIGDAINKKPDAMVIANFFPDAENPVIKQAVDAGIPVIISNTGSDNWQELGALSYVGLEPAPVGEEAAKQMVTNNAKNVLCVNAVPGNPFLEAVCQGLISGMQEQGATGTQISIPYSDVTNPTKVTQNIAGALKADPSIDGVFVFGSAVAGYSRQAAADAGRTGMIIGTGDLSTQVLKDIQTGDIAFALDSQPYLQSYYSILQATQYVRYGLMPIGITATGPRVIDKNNATRALEVNQQFGGIRGAA